MDIGMLWFDDDSRRGLDEKVARAAAYYKKKYGMQPTECHVNPAMLGAEGAGDGLTTAGVRVRPNRTVIRNHLWLGVGNGKSNG